MKANGGALSDETRFELAKKAFAHTARYDGAIANYLTALDARRQQAALPRTASTSSSPRRRPCATARTRTSRPRSTSSRCRAEARIATARQLQGKELSYNNIADTDAALECVKQFDERRPASSSSTPTRAAWPIGANLLRSLRPRLQDRPDIGLRRHHRLQRRAGCRRPPQAIVERQFVEVIIAPEVSAEAPARSSPPRRTCACWHAASGRTSRRSAWTSSASTAACWCRTPTWHAACRRPEGGDQARADRSRKCTTCCSPGAWPSTSSPTPSSTAKDGMTIGVGAGQMSRVDSARIAAHQGRARRPAGARLGDGLRRLLPVPRRHRLPAAGRHHRGDPARRLDARRGSDRRRRRARHGDGVHRHAAFPALSQLTERREGRKDSHDRHCALTSCAFALLRSSRLHMKILVIGCGGREHALAWKLAQIAARPEGLSSRPATPARRSKHGLNNVAITADSRAARIRAAAKRSHLTVVGPEAPLAAGVVDAFRAAGLKIFGPTAGRRATGKLQGFRQGFMARHSIPTAAYRHLHRCRRGPRLHRRSRARRS